MIRSQPDALRALPQAAPGSVRFLGSAPSQAKNPLGTHTILSEWCLFKGPISPDGGLSIHASAVPND